MQSNDTDTLCFFKGTNAVIEFSQRICTEACSRYEYLAIYIADTQKVYVIKIDRPLPEIMRDLSGNEDDESKYHIVHKLAERNLKRITFDVSNRLLVGIGEKMFVIFNLEDTSVQPLLYVINPLLYESI